MKTNQNLSVAYTILVIFAFVLSGCGQATDSGQSSRNTSDSSGSNSNKTVVNFGHVPSISASEKLSQLKPLKDHLESELPVNFKINFAENYSEVIEKVNNGEYDFVTFGPLSYVEAQQSGNIVASLKPERFGQDYYRSIIITNNKSGIDEISDLKGENFAFVDKKSTSGYLFPRSYLQQNGINPDEDLKGYNFMGSHIDVVVGVWLENYSAGAVYEDARKDHDNSDQIIEETKVIDKTDTIPNEPWAFRKGFVNNHSELVDDIKSEMQNLHESGPEQQRILDKLGIEGFVPAKDSDYDIVKKYLDHLNNEQSGK